MDQVWTAILAVCVVLLFTGAIIWWVGAGKVTEDESD